MLDFSLATKLNIIMVNLILGLIQSMKINNEKKKVLLFLLDSQLTTFITSRFSLLWRKNVIIEVDKKRNIYMVEKNIKNH